MCTKVIRICIFTIYILTSKGDLHPQEDKVFGKDYDEPHIDPNNEKLLSYELNANEPIDYEVVNDETFNGESIIESEGMSSNSKLEPEDEYYEEDGVQIIPSDYEYPDQVTMQVPRSNEILNRNKPEAGFDLTFDEMTKLKLWPDALIPYYIDVHSFNDKVMRDKIRSFLSSVNSLTSLNFVELPSPPINDEGRWVIFINRQGLLGCADHSIRNFTNSGVQRVVLGYHCMSTEGELAEAVLAIAGVPAQHTSPDRDSYIKINEQNIIPDKRYLFQKLMNNEWLFHDMEYDFKSVGHFYSYKHSINGRPTLEPKKKPKDVALKDLTLGESNKLTASDILKIRMLYNFIVKKKLLQASDCHKLFEPGKKFGQYKPSDTNLKSRPKPAKYTGENPVASLEGGFADVSDFFQTEYEYNDSNVANDNDNFQNVVSNEGLDQYNGFSDNKADKKTGGNEGQIESMIPNSDNEAKHYNFHIADTVENNAPDMKDVNISPNQQAESEHEFNNFNDDNKKKATIVNIHKSQLQPVTNKYGDIAQLGGGLAQLKAELPENHVNMIQPLSKNKPNKNSSGNKMNTDLVSVLSDYHTDEDKNSFLKGKRPRFGLMGKK